jgi:GH25 family lysozyme M1 (1,4-beta-N-acetylmuramidase)
LVACRKARVVADWAGAGVTAANVLTFLQAIASARPNLELTVYCDPATVTGATVDAASATGLSANTSFWIEEYGVSTPTVPSAWGPWSLWQYSDTAASPTTPDRLISITVDVTS